MNNHMASRREGGAFTRCVSSWGAYDMHGNRCIILPLRMCVVCCCVRQPLWSRFYVEERLILTACGRHEWISEVTPGGTGVFKGGFFVDAKINGPGCFYATTAHAQIYHDYSTGFRCCANPLGGM